MGTNQPERDFGQWGWIIAISNQYHVPDGNTVMSVLPCQPQNNLAIQLGHWIRVTVHLSYPQWRWTQAFCYARTGDIRLNGSHQYGWHRGWKPWAKVYVACQPMTDLPRPSFEKQLWDNFILGSTWEPKKRITWWSSHHLVGKCFKFLPLE